MTATPSHLDLLEAESIHIFREAAAQFRKPVLMYSIGKDSPSSCISPAKRSGRRSRPSPCSTSIRPGNFAT